MWKAFSQNTNFINHLRKYNRQCTYQYNYCEKVFARNSILIHHLRTHNVSKANVYNVNSESEKTYKHTEIKKEEQINNDLMDKDELFEAKVAIKKDLIGSEANDNKNIRDQNLQVKAE